MGVRKVFVAMNLIHDEIIKRFSSLNRAIRTIAYCKRITKPKNGKNPSLTVEELNDTKSTLIKLCHKIHFEEDMDQIMKNGQVNRDNKLKTLFPFIDGNSILRVGGRLKNSEFSEKQKHPAI